MIQKEASASGGISELQEIGAEEGIHYRISAPGEDITKYPIAFDRGPMVELLAVDEANAFTADPDFGGFAIVNADGMQLVGCHGIAAVMRSGEMPGEAAYLVVPD